MRTSSLRSCRRRPILRLEGRFEDCERQALVVVVLNERTQRRLRRRRRRRRSNQQRCKSGVQIAIAQRIELERRDVSLAVDLFAIIDSQQHRLH